jgi:hypothetical protein
LISDPEANPIQHLIRAGTIYIGLLGQGIICLVDQVQAPGHYREGWHGRNGQEQAVAGGVYVYCLTSSTVFTDTRRITLLKQPPEVFHATQHHLD